LGLITDFKSTEDININNQQHCEGKRLGKPSKMMICKKAKKVVITAYRFKKILKIHGIH
jgi:hypothetical protein